MIKSLLGGIEYLSINSTHNDNKSFLMQIIKTNNVTLSNKTE